MNKEEEKIQELNSPINIDDSFDFCANIISGWHLSVLYAYLRKLKEELKRDINGIVIISVQYVNTAQVVRIHNENLQIIEGISIKYYYNHFTFGTNNKICIFNKLLVSNNKNGKPIFLISPLKYSFSWMRYCIFSDSRDITMVRIDEGLGTYNYSTLLGWFAIKEQKSIILLLKTIVGNLLYLLSLKYLRLNKFLFDTFFLFKKEKSKLVINQEFTRYIKPLLITKKQKTAEYEQESILIIKDYDTDILTEQDSILFYKQLISEIRYYTEKKIYIKRHPLDLNSNFKRIMNQEFTDIEIIDSSLGIEEFLEQLKPLIIFGGTSTAAYTTSCIFNIPVINYSLLYNDYKLMNVERGYKKMIKNNYKCFKSLSSVFFIKNLKQDNFRKLLDGIFNK